MPYRKELFELAYNLKLSLCERQQRLVLAESCTAGLIAATLAQVAGMSEVLTGSAVVYQVATKQSWLGISSEVFKQHDVVSKQVSLEMARGVLAATPHANISVAITGHLGPGAPDSLDGIAWTAVGQRTGTKIKAEAKQLKLFDDRIPTEEPNRRCARQQFAALQALRFLEKFAN